jgi:hypothetical protein
MLNGSCRHPELLQLVRDAAIANELGDYAEQLVGLARPSLVLATSRAKGSTIPVGSTKFGGSPDLPDSVEWPTWNRQLLGFYAQINLAEVAQFQLDLPTQGLLSFFFTDDFDITQPIDSGAGAVVLSTTGALRRRKPPDRAPERFQSCSVRYIPYPSLPPIQNDESSELWGLNLQGSDHLHESYAECIDNIDRALGVDQLPTPDGFNYHQLLGYPDQVQSTPIEVCMERARNEPPPPPLWKRVRHSLWEEFKNVVLSRNPPIYTKLVETPRPPVDLVRCRDWRLLLMVREDEHAGFRLIDSGCIYYMYPSEPFRCADFSEPWTILDHG